MASFIDVLVVIAMFALRIGIPVAIVLGLGYLLKRLDRRWEAEARAEQTAQAGQTARVPAQPGQPPGRRPGQDVPGPQLPFDPASIGAALPSAILTSGRHCWDAKGCSPEKVAQCPACDHPELPCWQARTKAEHQMPNTCFGCDIFKNYPNV
jgi:hypothetical protein